MDDLQQLPDEDLWSRLADAEGRDRLEILFELGGRASRRGVYDRATTLWQEAQAVAEQLDDYRMAAEALRLQGAAAFYSEDYPAAIHLYREAAHGHEQAGQTREAAGALWCLADAFRALGDSEGDPVPAPLDAAFLAQMPHILNLVTDFGVLDLTFSPAGPKTDYQQWEEHASSEEIADGMVIRVASLDDIIESKRDKDLRALPYLESLRDVRDS